MKKAFLIILFMTSVSRADELTVYAYPAPMYIDWHSPSSLTWSTVLNNLTEDDTLIAIHNIGHMNFDLDCRNSSGTQIITGQTSDGNSLEDEILNQGYGLGASLTPTPGKWETPANIYADLPTRYNKGTVAFMKFSISAENCNRAAQYLQEYQQKNLDKIYGGLQSRARYQEGAGCTAFATSVMEVAGVLAPEFKQAWLHTVRMQYELIGGPTTGNHVELSDLLFGTAAWTWASSSDDSYALTFWDPYKVVKWIQKAAKKATTISGMTYKPSKNQKAYGLLIDATSVPAPTEPFWLQN
jgi:hypothetical protein